MKLITNRKFAWAVLAVCVAASIIGFGGGSLAAQRRSAVRVFNDGIDTSFAVRFSMDAYLESCAGYARTMAEEYRLHVDKDSSQAADVLSAAAQIGDGEDLDARFGAYKSLCSQIDALYTDFFGAELSEENRTVFKKAYSNFQGEVSKIKYDEYHALAAKYNSTIEGFPASMVSMLLGLDVLNEF